MSKNLPQIYKENIFKRFFKYVSNLISFNRKEIMQESNVNDFSEKKENLKNNFLKDIKIEDGIVEKELEKKKMMEDLKNNLQLLEGFSIEELKKILEYYQNENEKKKIILKKLSA